MRGGTLHLLMCTEVRIWGLVAKLLLKKEELECFQQNSAALFQRAHAHELCVARNTTAGQHASSITIPTDPVEAERREEGRVISFTRFHAHPFHYAILG